MNPALRKLVRKTPAPPADIDAFVAATEFPLVEWSEDGQRWEACHHPFTAPDGELEMLETGRRPARGCPRRPRRRPERRGRVVVDAAQRNVRRQRGRRRGANDREPARNPDRTPFALTILPLSSSAASGTAP